MTEGDWDLLLKWNNDPDVLYRAEEDDITSRTLHEVQVPAALSPGPLSALSSRRAVCR